MTPLVSIIIPTFDRPRYLQEAIESGLAQTYSNIEVCTFDNGTLDETLAVAGDAARRDPRVRFQRNERNLGMSANFNALARAARGEFLVAIGDDDRLLPEFVSRLVGVMRPELGVAFFEPLPYQRRRDAARTGEPRIHAALRARYYPGRRAREMRTRRPRRQSIPMSASLLRTADLQRLGFREDFNTPDVEFFIRLALQGSALHICAGISDGIPDSFGRGDCRRIVDRGTGRMFDSDRGEARNRALQAKALDPDGGQCSESLSATRQHGTRARVPPE